MFCMCHLRMELPKSEKPKNCIFCNRCEDDELQYGKFYKLDGDIVTHYFCLLLSSNMEQNGRDNEGILGFLREDILKELKRGKRLTCSYCKLTGASLGCCVARCKKKFHLPCGLKAGSLHQYFGQFKSFCANHRPTQMIDPNILKQGRKDGVTCFICYEELDTSDLRTILWAPCCRVNAWFHRKCVQRMAMTAGYFFKCPMCNNKEMFYETMQQFGIYIPEQDAAWELEPNAYQDLLYRHHRCDTAQCLDPKGREHEVAGTRWEIVLCLLCGSKGTHLGCANLSYSNVDWECDDCSRVGSSETINESDGLTNNPEASVARRPRPRSWRGSRRRITRKQKIVRQPSNDEDDEDEDDDEDDDDEEEDRVSTPSAEATSSNRHAGPPSPGTTTATYGSPPPRSESSDQSSSSDSDSGETSTVPHLASQTVLDVITLDSDDDDDDEVIVITDDDAEENDKSSNTVVFSCDGRKIPVASIQASSNNLCVEGDLAVRMPGDANTQAGQIVDPLLEEAMIDTVQCDSRNLVNITRTGMNNNNTMVLVNPKTELRQNPNIQVNSSKMQSNQNKAEPQNNSSLSQTNTVLLPWPQTAATNATRIPAPQTANVPNIQSTSVNTVNPERICQTNQSLQPSRIQVQQPRKYQEMQPPRRQGQQPLQMPQQLAQGQQQQQSQVQQSTILREQQSATQFGSYSSVREPSHSNKRLRTTEQMPDTSHSVSSQTTGSVLKTYLSEPRGSRQQATNQTPVMMSQQIASPSMAMYGDSYGQPVMLMMPQEQLPTQTSYIGEQTVNQPSLLLVPQEPDQQNAMSVDPAANSSLLNGDGKYNADIPAICPDNDSYAATAIGTATTAIGAATTNSISANDATATRKVTATTNTVSENYTSATNTVTAREPTTSAEQQNYERHRRGNRTGGQHSHTGLIPTIFPKGDFSFKVTANTFMFIPDNYNYPCVRAVSKGHSRVLVRPRSPSIPRTSNNSEGRSRPRTRPVRLGHSQHNSVNQNNQRSTTAESKRSKSNQGGNQIRLPKNKSLSITPGTSQSTTQNSQVNITISQSVNPMINTNRKSLRLINASRCRSATPNRKTDRQRSSSREVIRNRSQSSIVNSNENIKTRSRSCSTSSTKMHSNNRSTPTRETNRSRSQSRIANGTENIKTRSRSTPTRETNRNRSQSSIANRNENIKTRSRSTPRETNRNRSQSRITNRNENRNTRSRSCSTSSRKLHRKNRSAPTRETNRSRSQSRITKRIKNKKVRSRSHSASTSRKMHKKRRNTPSRETNRSKSHSTSTMCTRSRSASTRNTKRSRSTTPYGEKKVISPLYSNVEVFQNQMITRRKKEESCMQLRRLGGRKRTYASIMTSPDLTLDYGTAVFPGRRRLSCRMTEKLDPNTRELNSIPVPQETDSVLASNIDTDRKETPNTVSQQEDISSKRPSRPSSRNSVLSERPQPSSLNSIPSERPHSLSRNNFPSRSVVTRSWSKTVLRKRKRKDLSPSFEYPKLTSQPRRRSNSASTASRRSKMNNRILSRKSRTRTRSEGDPVSEDEREVITEVTSYGYKRVAIEDSVQKSSYSENIFKIKRLALSARKSMPESERTLHEQRKNLEKLQKLNSMSFGEGLPDLL